MKVDQVSDLKEKVKVSERQNEISMICFTIFSNIMTRHSCALYYVCMYVCMYFGIFKTGLLTEFCTHYSLL